MSRFVLFLFADRVKICKFVEDDYDNAIYHPLIYQSKNTMYAYKH